MRIENAIASLLCVSLLSGCLANKYTVPVTEAPQLQTGVVTEVDGDREKIGANHTVELVPFPGHVLLREGGPGGVIKQYPNLKDGAARPDSLKPLPRLGGPVSGSFEADDLVLKGPLDTFIVPRGAVTELHVLAPSPGKTAGLWIGLGLGSVAIAFGILIAVAIANYEPEPLFDCTGGCFAGWSSVPGTGLRPTR